MATNTRLVTFNAQNVTPQDDGLLYETAIPQTGIIYGADLSANGTNTVHIDTGFGIVRGRFFEIFESDIAVPLSSSGEIEGRIIGRLDLSNIDEPFVILAQTGTLAPLRQDADVNIFNGVHEFLLATFVVNEITISNFQDVKPTTFGSQTIVTTLPTEGVAGTIYLVPHSGGMYQYVWNGTDWTPLGQDLSAYAKLDSPAFVGTPIAPTNETKNDTSEQIATDKFVQNAIEDVTSKSIWEGATVPFAVQSGRMATIEFPTAAEEEGVYIGLMSFKWQSNANGYRIVEPARKRGTNYVNLAAQDSRNAVNGLTTNTTILILVPMNTGDQIAARLFQNSGVTLNIEYATMRITRIRR